MRFNVPNMPARTCQVAVCQRAARPQPHHGLKARLRLRPPLQLLQDNAHAGEGVAVAGPQTHGFLVAGQRLQDSIIQVGIRRDAYVQEIDIDEAMRLRRRQR